MYLKDGNSTKGSEGDGQITAILDQKNYVEELNRHLSATVNNLQAKVDALEKSNTKLTEEVSVTENNLMCWHQGLKRYGRSYFGISGVWNDQCLTMELE
ncbi:PREDICTED: protein RUFY3-like [Calidris pugnax]|uniref:protein RUFY3-like n=1 Tax=Calidris pugnax TaxID=198806 RepID=UPI00071CC593|nr:PREDICTED: protein RUFY3-like [Calidris pugnax]